MLNKHLLKIIESYNKNPLLDELLNKTRYIKYDVDNNTYYSKYFIEHNHYIIESKLSIIGIIFSFFLYLSVVFRLLSFFIFGHGVLGLFLALFSKNTSIKQPFRYRIRNYKYNGDDDWIIIQ
jgi:small-conductance mechanosensitive channel